MKFFKLSGCGNDFIALVEPDTAPTASDIAAWCRRGVSLGADGLFVLRRVSGGVSMAYWNGDGRPADLCLNGTRCAARLAFELGWAAGETVVRTAAGSIPARAAGGDQVELEIPAPDTAIERTVSASGDAWRGYFVEVGVPHFVVLWPGGLGGAPVASAGPELRHHPAFGAAGANVDFVRFPTPHQLEIRTFERGVEAETLACGTGVLASTAAGLAAGAARLPLAALTAGGFELGVRSIEGRVWALTGDARIVAAGELRPEARRAPEPAGFSA